MVSQEILIRYKVYNPQEVLHFIADNPPVETLLLGADREINNYFPEPTLYLDLFQDLTSESGTHLVLAIATTIKSDEALEKFDGLIKNWFSKVSYGLKGRLSLDLELN